MRSLLLFLLLVPMIFSCSTTRPQFKKPSALPYIWLPFAPARVKQVYNHSLVASHRWSSDCEPFCPDVDVWHYQFRDPQTRSLIESATPISIKKQYWRNPDEARIIAITMFDGKEFYYQALLQYLESFSSIKRANNITDPFWGYETFTVRVYVSKRNPKDLARLGEIENRTPDYIIDHLLNLGCEIAYVDNKMKLAKKDGTFWRFAASADVMPAGERVRYLMRDADNIVTAAEMYAVADWIKSGARYHRMHLIPTCFGPLTAMLWGGVHDGTGDFSDFHDLVKNYPYRYQYGDDELFTRDLMWPRLKFSGSVVTHHFPRSSFLLAFGSPYKDSCEEPTQKFCEKLQPNSHCEDRIMPDTENFSGVVAALGMRVGLQELLTDRPEIFNLELERDDRKFIYEAFRGN